MPKSWQRKPKQRPDAILDSALILFQQNGFTATRIEDIAKGANLSKGAVYLYFESKQAMLKALVKRSVLPLAEQIETLAQATNTAEVLPALQFIVTLAGTKLQDPKIAAVPMLILSEAGKFPELATFYRETILDRLIGALSQLLRKGKQEGLFRQDLNPEYAVRSLMGGIFLQMVWAQIFDTPPTKSKQIQPLLDHHLELFLIGISKS